MSKGEISADDKGADSHDIPVGRAYHPGSADHPNMGRCTVAGCGWWLSPGYPCPEGHTSPRALATPKPHHGPYAEDQRLARAVVRRLCPRAEHMSDAELDADPICGGWVAPLFRKVRDEQAAPKASEAWRGCMVRDCNDAPESGWLMCSAHIEDYGLRCPRDRQCNGGPSCAKHPEQRSEAAQADAIYVTVDRRYGKREAHASHADALREARREPGMIDVVAYVPRSAEVQRDAYDFDGALEIVRRYERDLTNADKRSDAWHSAAPIRCANDLARVIESAVYRGRAEGEERLRRERARSGLPDVGSYVEVLYGIHIGKRGFVASRIPGTSMLEVTIGETSCGYEASELAMVKPGDGPVAPVEPSGPKAGEASDDGRVDSDEKKPKIRFMHMRLERDDGAIADYTYVIAPSLAEEAALRGLVNATWAIEHDPSSEGMSPIVRDPIVAARAAGQKALDARDALLAAIEASTPSAPFTSDPQPKERP